MTDGYLFFLRMRVILYIQQCGDLCKNRSADRKTVPIAGNPWDSVRYQHPVVDPYRGLIPRFRNKKVDLSGLDGRQQYRYMLADRLGTDTVPAFP